MEQNNHQEGVSKNEVEKNLKENIITVYKQMKYGCYRSHCYNIYCGKNKLCVLGKHELNYLLLDNANKSEKDIMMEIFRLFKLNDVNTLLCTSNDEIKAIEDFLNELSLIKDYDFNEALLQSKFPQANINLNILQSSLKAINNSFSNLGTFLKAFNVFFNHFVLMITSEINKQTSAVVNYVLHYQSKALLYVLSHHSLDLTNTNAKSFKSFFENYCSIKNISKKYYSSHTGITDKKALARSYIGIFEEMKHNQMLFKSIVSKCHQFLTLILFSIGAKDMNDGDDAFLSLENQTVKLLEFFVKSFKTLFNIHEAYSLLDYREFYNDGLSNNLHLKRECYIYHQIINKSYKNKKPFCLISYIWLFDAAAKHEIIHVFNYQKQRSEVQNTLQGEGLFSMINAQSIFLMLKVNRNNLIKETLDAVSSPSINLQKPLKVKFENEQGVDEGGVRKEFFMLLVRQLFDPNYGMFSYNDKLHLFWFNLYSFEPNIKYEFIGIILGLALFNNVILDIKFPIVVYKKLLDHPLQFEDLKECDPDLYQTLLYLKNTNDENLKDILYVNFTVTVDRFGEKIEIPLKEHGEDIFVNNNNKQEYIDLYLDWYFNISIEKFFAYFKTGFYRVCNKEQAKVYIYIIVSLLVTQTRGIRIDYLWNSIT